MITTYNKNDAVMTRGFAILCMVVLHLFCRTGANVFGTPLIWINQEKPLVYWFGFYAEICVSVYSICMGYAQYLLHINGKTTWRSTGKRILKLLENYWIILGIFSIIGLIYSAQNQIPGSLINFLESIVLLHSYNGAWWFLNTYIIFLLIPAALKFFPVKKISAPFGLILCIAVEIGCYLLNRTGFWENVPQNNFMLALVFTELHNLVSVFPATLAGAYLCKGDIVCKVSNQIQTRLNNQRIRKLVLSCIWLVLFVAMNLIHKAAITLVFAILSFLLFNIWEKGSISEKFWLFLGKHSTNIWLTHMFFYAFLFVGLVQKVKYPLAMLILIIVLSLATSYVEMFIEKLLKRICRNEKRKNS